MKKLKLKALALGASEMLSREQLKNVVGGLGCNTHADCPSGYACTMTVAHGAYQGICCNGEDFRDTHSFCSGSRYTGSSPY